MKWDPIQERCLDLKLCDFGMSCTFDEEVTLDGFCGSPGFFAPEM